MEICNKVKQVLQQHENDPEEDNEISDQEVKKAIKKLKRKKSLGPDKIPNEIFIEASDSVRSIYTEMINRIHKTEDIPTAWLIGEIKRLYKGKGKKGK